MELTKSQEDYLEAVYVLSLKKENVRIKHIAEYLDVKNPSVLKAVKILKKKDLVEHHRYGFVKITEKGKNIAKKIYDKHIKIKDFFSTILRIPDEIAEEDACHLEHTIHKITFDRMTKFLEFIKNCPKGEPLEKFSYYLKHGERPND